MNKLILVGGASASGKSSFTQCLNQALDDSLAYRRVQAFFDIADAKKITRDRVFKEVTSLDADDWFFQICKTNSTVISDVHYALQMDRTFVSNDNTVNIYQEYVPTISPYLINKLIGEEIEIIATYLDCPAEILYERALKRTADGTKSLRAISLEDVQLQMQAEQREWQNLSDKPKVKSIKLHSNLYSPREMANQFVKKCNY